MKGATIALRVLAGAYLAGVWFDGVGSTLPSHLLPRVPNYFLQVAALFPRAATMTIDYRAEAWVCADRKWEELDTRPYFPLDPEDKENRFQRVMHFFRQDETTMHALDATTGAERFSAELGGVTRFVTPAAKGNQVVVAAANSAIAFTLR